MTAWHDADKSSTLEAMATHWPESLEKVHPLGKTLVIYVFLGTQATFAYITLCGCLAGEPWWRRRWSQPIQELSAHSREPSASDLLTFVPWQSCSTCVGGVIAQIWWAISTFRFYVLLICDKNVLLQHLWPPNMSVEIWIFSWSVSSWGSMYSLTFAVGNVSKHPHLNDAELLGTYFVPESDMKTPTQSAPTYSVTSFARAVHSKLL